MLLFSELQPLDPQFRVLPCQAIQCCLENTLPFSPSTGVWSSHVCDWFSSLLLGMTIEVSISESTPNGVSLEILLPQEQLEKSILPNVIQGGDYLDKQSMIPLSLFMASLRLSTRPHDMKSDDKRANCHISSLQPLLVNLNAAGEFTCLMSHVADELHFYIHPVQEDLAHTMNLINDVLYSHYSAETNRVHLSPENIKCGNVCCVYSMELQHWCRGAITSIKTDISGGVLTCLIFHLDYGVSEWMESSNVFTLVEHLCEYPSQVVCCSFKEVTADGCLEQGNIVLINPDIKGFVENTYTCSITRGEILSECSHFMRAATQEKQLFVVVKENGKY